MHTLSACWRRPWLTALEVLWRWAFGAPALALVATMALGVLARDASGYSGAAADDDARPDGRGGQLTQVGMPSAAAGAAGGGSGWRRCCWSCGSSSPSLGRPGAAAGGCGSSMRARVTLMALQTMRMGRCSGLYGLVRVLQRGRGGRGQWADRRGPDPELVLYCAIVIIATLGLFTLWAMVSWAFSVAPLLAMMRNLGARASLAAAFRLGPLRSGKLIEINLVMGIVKIALIVLAMVFLPARCPSRAWPHRSSWPGGMAR